MLELITNQDVNHQLNDIREVTEQLHEAKNYCIDISALVIMNITSSKIHYYNCC
jgi:hypothetical protein